MYNVTSQEYNVEHAILMGDFNAGCSYLDVTERSSNVLFTDSRFQIMTSNDTTVSTSSCPYDRIVSSKTLSCSLFSYVP